LPDVFLLCLVELVDALLRPCSAIYVLFRCLVKAAALTALLLESVTASAELKNAFFLSCLIAHFFSS
jgi:hypothetical protein